MEYMNPRECDVNLKYAKVSAKTMTLVESCYLWKDYIVEGQEWKGH